MSKFFGNHDFTIFKVLINMLTSRNRDIIVVFILVLALDQVEDGLPGQQCDQFILLGEGQMGEQVGPLLWIGWGSGGKIGRELRSVGLPGVLGGLGLVMAFSGAIYAFQATSVANAVLLFSASPFFAAILGRALLHEQVSALTWIAIGLAAIGIAVMVGGGLAGGALDGNIAALLSALGFAIFTVTLRWGKVVKDSGARID